MLKRNEASSVAAVNRSEVNNDVERSRRRRLNRSVQTHESHAD